MSRYELFCNPWEELERPSKRRRIEISRLAKRFIKVFKLQKSKKYSKLRYGEKMFSFFYQHTMTITVKKMSNMCESFRDS